MKPAVTTPDTRTIRRRVLGVSVVLMVIVGLVAGLLGLLPLRDRLHRQALNELEHALELQRLIIAEFQQRLEGLALQVSSRTRIRQELARYNRGEIDLAALTAFTEPKLADALREAPDLLGLVRLDRDGRPVARVGAAIEAALWPPEGERGQRVVFGQTGTCERSSNSVVLRVPIVDEFKQRQGTDILMFCLSGLGERLQVLAGHPHGMNLFARTPDGGWRPLFASPEGASELARAVTAESLPLPAAEERRSVWWPRPGGSRNFVVLARVAPAGWLLAVWRDQAGLLGPANRIVLLVGLAYVVLLLLGLTAVALLLRPLTGRLLVREEELRQLVEEQAKELVRADENLREKTLYLDTILRSSINMAIAATDGGLRLCYLNPLAEELFDLPKSRGIGSDLRQLHAMRGVTAQQLETALRQVREHGECQFLVSRSLPDGVRLLSARVSLIPGEAGQPAGYVLMARDVTEERNLEQERREMGEKLRRAERMESLGLMAGGVAHDLNNILTGILSYPELLLKGLPPDSSLRKPLETIHKAGERAAAVVAELLTIARGVAAPRQVLSVNSLIRDFFTGGELAGLRMRFPDLRFIPELGPGLLPVLASPTHLRKILLNLLVNSCEVLPSDGKIVIRTAVRSLADPFHGYEDIPPGEYVVLTVTDNGPGISPADLGRIFEPFFTKKVMGRSGTGLGLAVVWNAVHDHQGFVHVESRPGATSFGIYLPRSGETPVLDEDDDARDVPRGEGEQVLVVDDDPLQREVAGGILVGLGYQVRSVAAGEEAVALLAKGPFDLVLLDMLMDPGMNGRETYEKMLALRPEQKALVVSGYAESDDVRQTLAMGASAFLAKPYTLAQLGRAVHAALHRSTASPRSTDPTTEENGRLS